MSILYIYIYIYIINWITTVRKSGKHCVRHTGIPDSCFDLIRSHQQCISWFSTPTLEIEPVTTEYISISMGKEIDIHSAYLFPWVYDHADVYLQVGITWPKRWPCPLFFLIYGTRKVLPLPVTVDQGVMAMNDTFLKTAGLKPHNQMQFSVILRTLVVGSYHSAVFIITAISHNIISSKKLKQLFLWFIKFNPQVQ